MKKMHIIAVLVLFTLAVKAQNGKAYSTSGQVLIGYPGHNVSLQFELPNHWGLETFYQSNDLYSPEFDNTDVFPDRLAANVYYKHEWNELWSTHFGAGTSVSGRSVLAEGTPFRGMLNFSTYYALNERWSLAVQWILVANKKVNDQVLREPNAIGIGVRYQFGQL